MREIDPKIEPSTFRNHVGFSVLLQKRLISQWTRCAGCSLVSSKQLGWETVSWLAGWLAGCLSACLPLCRSVPHKYWVWICVHLGVMNICVYVHKKSINKNCGRNCYDGLLFVPLVQNKILFYSQLFNNYQIDCSDSDICGPLLRFSDPLTFTIFVAG